MSKNQKTSNKKIVRKEGAKEYAKGNLKAVKGAAQILTGQIRKGVDTLVDAVESTAKGGAKMLFNHPEWYENYNTEGMVNLNFGRRRGIFEEGVTNTEGVNPGIMSVPSVCQIAVLLTNGSTNSDAYWQGINIMYNQIRRANSGSVNYTPADLERYVTAVRNLHAAYFMLRRDYALLRNFSAYDSTVPAAYFTAVGHDYQSFRDNAANLREYSSLIGIQLEHQAPLKINLYDRTDWMFSNIFADSNDAKHSDYVFTNTWTFGYATDANGKVTGVNEYKFADMADEAIGQTVTGIRYENVISVMDNLMRDFSAVAVFQIIAGDILKAFGPSAIFPADIWSENEVVPIIYDEAALSQIQNATVFGEGFNISSQPTISENGPTDINVVIDVNGSWPEGYSFNQQFAPLLKHPFINSYKDNNKSSESISLTRLSIAIKEDSSEPFDDQETTWGTEVVVGAYAILRNSKATDKIFNFYPARLGLSINDNSPISYTCWSAFDYAPMTKDVVSLGSKGLLFDFNNYARASYDQLSTMHDYAMLSLLYVPNLIKQSNSNLIKNRI